MYNILKKRVLVVEDDKQMRKLITMVLDRQEYIPLTAVNGEEALTLSESGHPETILLDMGLPDMDGMDVIRRVRETSQVPIIVVSARNEDKSIIAALEAGADDYITKPFAPEELLARLRAGMRRIRPDTAECGVPAAYENGGLCIRYDERCAYVDGNEIWLTPSEYAILCLLAKNEGRILTHSELNRALGGRGSDDFGKLRVMMSGLRKKLQQGTESPQYIQTHIGVGYRMTRPQGGH